jgi:peptidoglycan/xylan/chitin deacetylase (PgdA/CDA1 family)
MNEFKHQIEVYKPPRPSNQLPVIYQPSKHVQGNNLVYRFSRLFLLCIVIGIVPFLFAGYFFVYSQSTTQIEPVQQLDSSDLSLHTAYYSSVNVAKPTKLINTPVIKLNDMIPDIFEASKQKVAPFIISFETKKPVIFLGIDDGLVKNPEALEFFKSRKWPVTLFLNKNHVDQNPAYFKSILATGANLGNHTNTHPNLLKLDYAAQKKEICDSQEESKKTFGITPKLFRPPYGNYNENTLKAAKECGLVAVIGWKARVDEGKVWYQVGDKLNKGEVVLMHFRPQIMDDLKAFEAEITKQNLTVGNLEEWVK